MQQPTGREPALPADEVSVEVVTDPSGTVGVVDTRPSAVSRARAAMGRTVSGVKQGAREGGGKLAAGARSNPLGAALGAMSLGFVAGLFAPANKVDQTLAPVAQGIGETAQQGKETVKEIKDSAVTGARQREREQQASS